jgi:hypothetical protein
MAAQISGQWQRQYVDYSGAQVWGTGIHPVHYYYGQDEERGPVTLREGEVIPPHQGKPDQLIAHELWGYTPEDSSYTGMEYDDRPNWTQEPSQFRADTDNQPSWTAPGIIKNSFRALFGGAHRTFRGVSQAYSPIQYQIPSETVSEGWLNKPQGSPANAVVSSQDQLERQTSLQQRYQTRNNTAAVERATDEPRAPINSKVTGQHLKVYSGGERHYDMLPKAQDTLPRPFWYRQGATGPWHYMYPNELWNIDPIERIPPPDPCLGNPETEITSEFGYTTEDSQFYG